MGELFPRSKMENELTLSEAKSIVKNQEDSITQLINPEDLIHQDIDSWENADVELLKDELYGSMGNAWTYGINHPYGDMIEELAVNRYVENMIRIPFDHLNPDKFNGPEDAVIEGYWLYDMSESEVKELVYEWNSDIEFFHEYENEAMQFVESIVIDEQIKALK